MYRTVPLLAALALSACQSSYEIVPTGWEAWQPHTADEPTLRAAASLPNLATFHKDLALRCPDFGPERDLGDGCEIAQYSNGEFVTTGVSGVMSAWRFDAERALVLDTSLNLALDDLNGNRTVIAEGALDPRVADDGHRAVFVQLASRGSVPNPGDPAYLTIHDTATGQTTQLTDHPLDTAPWLVPSSTDVLFASGRTGLASLWLAPGDGSEPRQLTNVGMTQIEAGFVPLPSRELVWLPGTRKAVYSAHYGTHELYLLDLDAAEAFGVARHLGRGRLPALHPDGGIIAVDDDVPELGRLIVRIPEEEL